MPRSLIALGANLGDRPLALRRAVELMGAEPSITRVAASTFHESAPIGGPSGQGAYLNAAVALETTLSPEQLHALLVRIELELGRRPAERWAARTIDLDLLLYGETVISTPTLSVPHPRMAFRRFVLAPAAEVAGEMVHPLIGWTIGRLLAHLDSAAPYVALLGLPDSGRSALAQRVARAVGGTYLAGPDADAPAGGGDVSSGHARERPIQFLDRAGRLLADLRGERAVVVSDFYFDECLAHARTDLDDRQYERFYRAWAAARQSVAQPKLLAVLDTWHNAVTAHVSGASHRPHAAERLRHELLALAMRPDVGPALLAGDDDAQVQFDEITAAIAAMR
jgi:2-amino-4-hydroxy-6-hydroxymethyldihydropteridine diphosphokinase